MVHDLIPALGEFALWIALPISIWGGGLAFLGGHRGRGDLVLSAERSVYAVFALLLVASASLVHALMTDRFDYWYVYSHSARSLEPLFKATAFWGGQRGSLLFWALNLGFLSALAVRLNRRRNRELMPWVAGVLLTVLAFLIVLALFVTPPFERLAFTPPDGLGLSSRLQNPWAAVHLPALHLGLAAFTIPFAFGAAALVTGRIDARWPEATRSWVLPAWFLLTLGILVGMRWTYEVPEWGGYWFWDPVANAFLLPWLVATALLHSLVIQESRGTPRAWNVGLVCLAFLLTILAHFLARSGLVDSVYPFAPEPAVAWILLGFLGVAGSICLVLILWRVPLLRSEGTFDATLSREAGLLVTGVVLVGGALAVAGGTLLPLITGGETGTGVAARPRFLDRVGVPIGLVLLALMGIGPALAWRKASGRNLVRGLLPPAAAAAAVGLLLFGTGVRHPYALLTFAIGAFVLAGLAGELWKGARARARIEGERPLTAVLGLVRDRRRRWGGYVVHVGVVITFMGFAGAAFETEVSRSLEPGESVTVASALGHEYTLTYRGLSTDQARNMWRVIALFTVSRDGTPLGPITAEHRFLHSPPEPVAKVGIRSSPVEDLYVIPAALDEEVGRGNEPGHQRASFRVLVRPLVPWIWTGGFLMAVGALVGLWPGAGAGRELRSSVDPDPGAAPFSDRSGGTPSGVDG